MGAIRLLKGETIVPSFDENGLSRVPLMPDANEEAKLFECALQKGKTWQPPLYGAGEKIQMFFFTAGSGYVTTETRAWNIAQGVFIPDYDREKVAIHAGTDLGLADRRMFRIPGGAAPGPRRCPRCRWR